MRGRVYRERMCERVFVRMREGEGHITNSSCTTGWWGSLHIPCPSLTHKHSCHTLSSPDMVSSRFFLWTSTRDLFLPERNLPTQKRKPISSNFQLLRVRLAVAFVYSIKHILTFNRNTFVINIHLYAVIQNTTTIHYAVGEHGTAKS